MLRKRRLIFIFLLAVVLSAVYVPAQSKRRSTASSAAATPESTPVPAATPPEPAHSGKKNERPAISSETNTSPGAAGNLNNAAAPVYFYEFTQPNFVVRKLVIEHDETGKGKISFLKGAFPELITDPLQVSPAAMERIRGALARLDFLGSTQSYQYEKDYSHLGNIKISVRKDDRERTSEFNYTTNEGAKALADEYRKLGNQYVWMFNVNLARENQPLQTPGLLKELDTFVRN